MNSIRYPVKPNGDLRICLDPKDLNKAIIREHHKAPTLEEITHKLCGATKFSKVDCYKGFFAYLMDKASIMKTTFNTIPRRGRYRYLRVLMGAKFSQDAYQMKMDQILEGQQGVIAIHDDIVVPHFGICPILKWWCTVLEFQNGAPILKGAAPFWNT